MSLALDEPNDDDATYTEADFTFCVNKELVEQTGIITVDVTQMGFVITTANPLGGSSGGCGSGSGCSTSGSCGTGCCSS